MAIDRTRFTLALAAGILVAVGAISLAVLRHKGPDKRIALRRLAIDTNDTLPKKAGEQLALVHVEFARDTWNVDYRYDDAVALDASRQATLKAATLTAVCKGAMWRALHHDYAIAIRYRFKDGGVDKTLDVDIAPRGCPWPMA